MLCYVSGNFREELRRWFISQETDLFRFRFFFLDSHQKKQFFNNNNLVYEAVSFFARAVYTRDRLFSLFFHLSSLYWHLLILLRLILNCTVLNIYDAMLMIQISNEEKKMLKDDLVAGTSGVHDFEITNFYKVNK